MKVFKKLLCGVLSACVLAMPLTVGVVSVGAEDISTLQEKLRDLDEKKKEYQEIIDKTSSDIAEKEAYNKALTSKIEVLDEKIGLTRESISELGKKISATQQEINEANSAIDGQLDALCERLRAIYMAGSASDLEIILGAKDFSDFIDKMTLIKTLSRYDRELIDDINAKLDVINEKKASMEADREELEAEETAMNDDLTDLNKLLSENREILDQLQLSNREAADALNSSKTEQSQIEAEIQKYFEEQAAQARARAAQQAAQQQSAQSSVNSSSSKPESSSSSKADSSSSSSTPSSQTEESSDTENGGSSYEEPYVDPTPSSGSGYEWPTPGYYTLTSVFGEPRSGYGHGAIDIGAPYGATIVAAESGYVTYSNNSCYHNWGKSGSCGCGGGYGNYVWISHGDGRETVYAHMTNTVVSTGDYVTKGQVIGYVGSTGWSTGAHMHFETRYNGYKYDPMSEY